MRRSIPLAAEAIRRAKRIVLAAHINPDGDTLGSILALGHALEAMGHVMQQRGGHSGIVAAIEKTAAGWVGVADPRYAGGALGY